MPSNQDQGTWCLFLPLKLGVGISCGLVFVHAIIGALALVSNDVRFQPNGYTPSVNKLPSVVNCVGIVIGFIGLVGMYDDRQNYLWIFNRYCAIRIIVMLAVAIMDVVTLQDCEGWSSLPLHELRPRMDVLSQLGVCSWARWSLIVGVTVELGFWTYLLVRCYVYEQMIAMNLPYKIDFGTEKGVKSKWAMYQVGEPSEFPKMIEQEEAVFYGSTAVPEQGAQVVATTRPMNFIDQRPTRQGESC